MTKQSHSRMLLVQNIASFWKHIFFDFIWFIFTHESHWGRFQLLSELGWVDYLIVISLSCFYSVLKYFIIFSYVALAWYEAKHWISFKNITNTVHLVCRDSFWLRGWEMVKRCLLLNEPQVPGASGLLASILRCSFPSPYTGFHVAVYLHGRWGVCVSVSPLLGQTKEIVQKCSTTP